LEAREAEEMDRLQVISWRSNPRNPVHILERGPTMTTQTVSLVHFSAHAFIQGA
jgi:hypothetical protein